MYFMDTKIQMLWKYWEAARDRQPLPYHTGKTFYLLAWRPPAGPIHIPELTIRLQNPQVQYSPGSIPTLGTIPLPSEGLLTWTLLVSPREYQLESTKAHPSWSPCPVRLQTRKPGCLLQAHPVYRQHYFVTQGAFTKHTLYNNSITL